MASTKVFAFDEVLISLKSLSSPEYLIKQKHFGIDTTSALGVRIPQLRLLAKSIKKNHDLATKLWNTGIHEARLLATMIVEPKKITLEQFDKWVSEFDSWDICDQTCSILVKTPFVEKKIIEYSTAKDEYMKRTAFVLICAQVFNYKKANDSFFYPYFELIERESWDDRNFVRKAINWALRQIGKKNENLRLKALEVAYRIKSQNTKSALWIAGDAIRELTNQKIVDRIRIKSLK